MKTSVNFAVCRLTDRKTRIKRIKGSPSGLLFLCILPIDKCENLWYNRGLYLRGPTMGQWARIFKKSTYFKKIYKKFTMSTTHGFFPKMSTPQRRADRDELNSPYGPTSYCRPLTATSVEFPTETPFRKKLDHMALVSVESYFSQNCRSVRVLEES